MKNLLTPLLFLFSLLIVSNVQAQITGVAYRDYNGNGSRQTVAPNQEPGIPGVIVSAYNASDALVNTTTTAADGTYTLAYSVPVRLEFTLPAGSGCVSSAIDYSSFGGEGNSIRFVSASGAQNYAINNPADYVGSTNPSVYVSQYANGNPLVAGTSQNATWFVGFPYNNTGTTAPTQTLAGAAATIGTTWGVAYSKQAQKVFTSAFVKRHTGLGTQGSGGIYMLTPTATSFTVTNFYDMDAVANSGAYRTRANAAATPPAYGSGSSYTLNNGGTNSTQVTYNGSIDAASGEPIGFGVIGTNVERGLVASFAASSNDPAAFDQVGKTGIGDIEISDDGRYLFVVNLYDRKVYRLTLNNAYNPTSVTAVSSYALPDPPLRNTIAGYGSVPDNAGHSYGSASYYDGTYGRQRPFALKYYRDKLYVGAMTTGENGGINVLENNSGTPEFTDMWTFVYEMNAPTGIASFSAAPTFNYPMNYNKGATITWTGPYALQWYPWTRNTSVSVGSGNDRTYPQPMLSNIEFSDKGDLLLNYTDRGGHQFGWWNYRNLSGTTQIGYPIGGDMLVAGRSCAAGTYTMEFNGAYTNNGTSYNSGAANNDGPGNSEFFKYDEVAGTHEETVFGSCAILPGDNKVMLTYMDPSGVIRAGGTAKFSMVDGAKSGDYQLYLSANDMSTGTLGKAGGLGDIELLGTNPGIEIGNRLWNDANGDGIQNAAEAIFGGVTVQLYSNGLDGIPGNADDALLGTTTSNAVSGEWYFNAANVVDGDPNTAGNQAGPQPNFNYNVRTALPAGYQLTKKDKLGYGAADQSDNDALLSPLNVPMISLITGAAGQNNHSYDFGFKPLASLGDKVWLDNGSGGGTANDGTQNGTEPGVAGITVSLFNSGGTLIGSTVTDAYGYYLFDNLAAGNYTVGFTLPANYTFAPQTNATDDGNTTGIGATAASINGSDANITTGRTYTISLSLGENNRNIDAGLIFNAPPITQSVGDKVWLDNGTGGGTASDGIQNGSEPGVAGITVALYNGSGVAIATTITDANGNYLFTKVPVGVNYTVGFTLPVGMIFSPNAGLPSNTTNSDANPLTGRTSAFNVIAGDNITYVDAGIYPHGTTKASLGDKVWEDTNQDGIQNANEPGIGGVTVNLYIGLTLIKTTTTDAFGHYMFTYLDPGNYIVEFVKPSGYTMSPQKVVAGTSATDSDPSAVTSKTGSVNLKAGDRNTSIDAGMYRTVPTGLLKLGDKVWNDYDQDGIQDANEPGMGGITVTLYQNGADGLPGTLDDVVIATTTTDVNGNYIFVNLAASSGATTNYNVQFANVPNGYSFTATSSIGSTTTNDSNPFNNGRTGSINLVADNLTIDAGLILGIPAGKGSLGDKVWYDLNNNGVQDAAELGVSAVTVTLQKDVNGDGVFSGAGELTFATTTTNSLGQYMFGNLDAASYRVVFSTMPVGFVIAIKDAGAATDLTDSDGDNAGVTIAGPTTSTTGVYILAQGEDNITVDLGILQPANRNTLGDYVWFDQNSDGLQTADEPGMPGVMITLYDNGGTAIAYTTTDVNGQYLFAGLADGNYSVGFTNLPAGFDFTAKSASNDLTGSDADILSGRTANVTLTYASGGTFRDNRSLDGGITSIRAALGNYVWLDTNGDGVQDATESGIPGVTVILYASDGTTFLSSAITDQNGKYLFSNLAAGSYVVGFSTLPGSLDITQQNSPGDNGNNTNNDADPVTGKTAVIVLSAGEVDLTIDGGVRPKPTATVSDFVWSDIDANGIQDPTEPGIGGIVVTLYNSLSQPVGSAITDGTGRYIFTNVTPGVGYYIIFSNVPNNPSGIQPSFTLQGANSGTTTSHANASGVSNTFTVLPGDNITNMDAGIKDYPGRAVLAVQKMDVYATLKGNAVTVSWTTTNEVNTSKFIVERSVNNTSFSYVGEKAAAGNSIGIKQYSLVDDITLLSSYPVIYYRVKLINLDGGSSYSKVVAVKLGNQTNVSVWPNPFVDKLTVSLVSSEAGTVQLRLLDYSGKTIRVDRFNVVKGNNQLYVNDLKAISSGLYLLQVEDDKGITQFAGKLAK